MADKYVNASGISALKSYIDTADSGKQDTLVSGTNIKTINNESLLGSGNIDISGGSSDVFVATYGSTTYQEVLDAYNNYKIIVVKQNQNSYNVSSLNRRDGTLITMRCMLGNAYMYYSITSGNVWSVIDSSYLQKELVSGTDIKTINGNSILGSGDLVISGSGTVDDAMSDTSENAVQNKVIKSYTDKKYPPIQTQGNYKYRIYDDGTFEVWFKQTGYTITINNASGNLYRSPLTSLALPSNIYNNYTCNIIYASVDCGHNNYPAWGLLASIYDTGVNFYAMSGGSRSSSPNYTLSAYMWGTLS